MNLLSVAVQGTAGKKRLILDLSPVNFFIKKQKFKIEDYKEALIFLEEAKYGFCFDLKSAYQHVEIHPDFVKFLGFSWVFNGRREWFQFNVLCFGISTGPRVFTKLLKPLVARWRAEGIKLIVYLDDGLGLANSKATADAQATRVKRDLQRAGLCINEDKSVWQPCKHLKWLGIEIDLDKRQLKTPQDKREATLNVARRLIPEKRPSARQLAQLTGRIISMRLVLGDLAVIGTKRLCRQIIENVDKGSWDWHHTRSEEVTREIAFWIRTLLKDEVPRHLHPTRFSGLTVFSDASAVAAAAFIEVLEYKVVRNFTMEQRQKSSAWRELMIVHLGLEAWEEGFKGKAITWCTDNQAITHIVKKGSMKPELNLLAAQISAICVRSDIELKLTWIPRETNKKADAYSREVDMDDWGIESGTHAFSDKKFGPHDFDRFANAENRKCTNFNSLNWEKGSQGVDALSFDWKGYNNWVVPPPYLLAKVVQHMLACAAEGTVIMPEWPSNPVWPIVMPDRKPAVFVKDIIRFKPGMSAIKAGNFEKSVFSSENLKADVLAFRISPRCP